MNTHTKVYPIITCYHPPLQLSFDSCNVANIIANVNAIVGKIGEKALLQTANITASVITIFIYFCTLAKYIYIWGFCKRYFFDKYLLLFWRAKQ
jgi:hypothetical protein